MNIFLYLCTLINHLNTYMNKINFWIKNARSIALPQSVLPALLAISMGALHEGFSWWMALVSLFGIICAHLGMNLADDYFDYKVGSAEKREALDGEGFRARMHKYPYITSGQATITDLRNAIIAFLSIAVVCGLVILIFRGWHIALIAAIAGILGLSYSGGPLKLGYHGYGELVRERSGLLIDPYFSGSGAKWLLDNVEGAREAAESGELCFGTIDTWLIFKLTEGVSHTTDYTNASRTMLFNIHTMDWDDDLLNMLTIPRSMMPKALPCDSVFGETTLGGVFAVPVKIAGVLGDSHGALAGQMCFGEGFGKATYGTGSSVMVNIGEKAVAAPGGLVTSVAFSALGRNFYAFEGNIHCTGVTITWLKDQLGMINSPAEIEAIATSVEDNGGVYLVPAFSGLGAPWWNDKVKGMICGLSLGSTKAHICRATLESIAYQVADLINAMTKSAGIRLQEVRVDGGPTKNKFLMQFQADILGTSVIRPKVTETTALGAAYLAGLAVGYWESIDHIKSQWGVDREFTPQADAETVEALKEGWADAIRRTLTEK